MDNEHFFAPGSLLSRRQAPINLLSFDTCHAVVLCNIVPHDLVLVLWVDIGPVTVTELIFRPVDLKVFTHGRGVGMLKSTLREYWEKLA